MNEFIRKIGKTLIIAGIVLCSIGLIMELLFFINVKTKLQGQSEVSYFVRQMEENHAGTVSMLSVYHGRMIIRVSTDITINEMETIVDEYEEWNSKSQSITKIIFVDENATDTMMGYSSDCMIVFAKSGENEEFDIVDIMNASPELYPQMADFSSYQGLSGRYRFNVNVPISIDSTDDFSVIESWYCLPETECVGEEYLTQNGVNVTSERNIEID